MFPDSSAIKGADLRSVQLPHIIQIGDDLLENAKLIGKPLAGFINESVERNRPVASILKSLGLAKEVSVVRTKKGSSKKGHIFGGDTVPHHHGITQRPAAPTTTTKGDSGPNLKQFDVTMGKSDIMHPPSSSLGVTYVPSPPTFQLLSQTSSGRDATRLPEKRITIIFQHKIFYAYIL